MKTFGTIILIILILFATIALSFGLEWMGLEWEGFFKAKKANIDREVFENTKSYVEGMIGDLADYQYEFKTAENEVEKKAIGQLIRNKYADFDYDLIDNIDLKLFLQKILRGDY